MSLEKFIEQEQLLDRLCHQLITSNRNLLVPWFLMAAYAYYQQDDPIITDSMYDTIVKKLLSEWEQIDHRHKSYIDYDALKSGTHLGQYPQRIKGAVDAVRKDIKK